MSAYSYTKALTKKTNNNITEHNNSKSPQALTNIYGRFPIFKSPYPHLRNDRSLCCDMTLSAR